MACFSSIFFFVFFPCERKFIVRGIIAKLNKVFKILIQIVQSQRPRSAVNSCFSFHWIASRSKESETQYA